jgi:hypothetical protein
MTISPARNDLSREVPVSAELLIKEAQRASRRRRMRNLAIVFIALIAVTTITVIQTMNGAPSKPTPETAVVRFVDSMKHASDTRFVATYRVANFIFFQRGVITVAQIPNPPGTKVTPNVDGYSGSGRYAYLFRGAKGRVAQWIKIGSNVSGCETPTLGRKGPMACSRPSPYIPSNGFAEEDVGFVPTYVMQSIQGFTSKGPGNKLQFTTRVSKQFGRLTCLTQTLAPMIQTTCIDQSGYVVLWSYHSDGHSMSVTLTTFNRHPTAKDFRTLIKPTKALVLPPF